MESVTISFIFEEKGLLSMTCVARHINEGLDMHCVNVNETDVLEPITDYKWKVLFLKFG